MESPEIDQPHIEIWHTMTMASQISATKIDLIINYTEITG